MTIEDIAAALTGERVFTKYTGGDERPSRDEIARLAYHLYETRGRRDGQDVDGLAVSGRGTQASLPEAGFASSPFASAVLPHCHN
jgi:Protein of unknown function (DUF2934)